jgi:ABC-type Fe3+/spermidine/putrescine transport system ATPase subunit
LREELHAIQRRVKITAIFVTHDQEEALSLADRIAVMSAGRLEQLDVPSQIYAHPRTLFVADFIGVMNIFGTTRAGDTLHIGQYGLRTPSGLNGSEALSVAVRPEDLLLVDPNQVSDPSLLWEGTIDQSIDLGHYRKVLVVVPGLFADAETAVMHRLKVYTPKSSEVKEGDRVWLYPTRYLFYAEHQEPVELRNPSLRTPGDNRSGDLSHFTQPAGKELQ